MRRFVWIVLLAVVCAVVVRANDPSPEALVEDGHWKRARAALEPRVQANPNDAKSVALLSDVKIAFRDPKAALTLAEKAADLEPKNADYRGQVAEAVCELAGKEETLALGRRCKRELEEAVEMNPKNVGARQGLMEWHMRAPWIIGGRKGEAQKQLEEIKRINPARGFLAQVKMNQLEKKSDSPEPLYLQALQADPQNYQAMMSLVNFYLNEKTRKLDLAEKYAREAMKVKPGRISPYSGLAAAFTLQERWNDLEAILIQAEKAISDNLTPYFQAGRLLANNGKELPRAERYVKKFLSIEPEPTSPQHFDAHFILSMIYEKMGRKPDAIREMEEVLRLRPDHEPAKKELKRLKQ